MGARKKETATKMKEAKKTQFFARLNNSPISPRKMRLVAGMIREVEVNRALDLLKFSPKHASISLEKLLLSAVANWQVKNEGQRLEDNTLFVKEVFVDAGKTLKRLRPAPQGRAHRIRKRSNHVTIYLGTKESQE